MSDKPAASEDPKVCDPKVCDPKVCDPTVYIVDDDQGARDSVRALARSLNVQAETFASAEEFLQHYDRQWPGCLVTDLRMHGMSGIELQENLSANGVSIPVIIITAHAETPITVKAVKRGAVTVLEKPCSSHELCDAIRAAIALDAHGRREATRHQQFHERLADLSKHERAVLDYMVDGLANKVTARRLGVSIRTVENRRQRIFEKTRTRSLAELIRLVVESQSDSAT